MSVGASIVIAGVGVCWSGCVSRAGGVHGSGIDKSVDESIDGSDSEKGDHPLRHPQSQPYRDLMPRVKRGGLCSEEANTLARGTAQDVSERPRSFWFGIAISSSG